MVQFETSGVLDEAVLREVARHGVTLGEKLLGLLYLICGVCLLRWDRYVLGALAFGLGCLMLFWYFIAFRRITVKRNLANMREINGTAEYWYATWLEEDGVAVLNHTNHAEGKIRYSDLRRVIETERIFALQTRRRQFVPVFKEGLSQEQQRELLACLKDRCGKLKIIGLKQRHEP